MVEMGKQSISSIATLSRSPSRVYHKNVFRGAHLVVEPELNRGSLSLQEKIEFYKIQQHKFDTWKKGVEIRRDMTLLDRCNQTVRKALLAAHPIEQVKELKATESEFTKWLRKAALDPTMSTYTRKAKAVMDNAMAKQFLSETDEVQADMIERSALATTEMSTNEYSTTIQDNLSYILEMCFSTSDIHATASCVLHYMNNSGM